MPQVKGLAFRSVLQSLVDLRGEAARERVLSELSEDRSQKLRFLVASSWLPIEDYAALWDAVQGATGADPDFPRVIGRRAVEHDLRLVHKVAFSMLSVGTVLGISARLFSAYYDTGVCRAKNAGERIVLVECSGCSGFTRNMWTELLGAMECFAEKASQRRASSKVVRGGRDFEPTLVAEVTWD